MAQPCRRMRGPVCAWRLQLLLLSAGALQTVLMISGQDTGNQPAAGSKNGSAQEIFTDCPAELVLALIKQSRELTATISAGSSQTSSSGGSQGVPPGGQAGALLWPPSALKQGLACTMELSQLSVAVLGTNKVCTVLGITNNLFSILHSWQLVWQQRGLVGEQATRATLLNSTASGDNTVQLINPPSSPRIPAQGGSVDVLVQLSVPAPPPHPPAPSNSINTGAQNQPPRAAPDRRPGSIRPAVESVLLNGLQCTRLPLTRPNARQLTENSIYFDDCGTADWPLDANGTLASLESNGSLVGWGSLTAWGGINSTGVSEKDVGIVLAALRQLSCVSQLCCGLQVLPNSVVTVGNSSSDAANSTEPPVIAMDGTAPNRSTGGPPTGIASQVESGAQPRDSALPADITPVQPPNQQQDSNTVGLVVGLVIAGVVVGCLGALLVVLLRLRRKWPGGQLKQQAAVQQALVRHESTASSNGSAGAGSLASLASAEWQQQQRLHAFTPSRPHVPWLRGPHHALPTHRTAPSHLLTAAAAAATAELSTGSVWRAGSWQGPDACPPAGAQLERSSSSPQPLQCTATGSTCTPHPTQPAVPLAKSNPNSPSTAHLHLPPAGPSHSSSQAAAAFAPNAAAAFAPYAPVGGSSPGGGGAAAPSAGGSPRDPLGTANYSSLNSTWGSLRRMLGNNRAPAPKSSTLASATSSNILTRHDSHQGPDTGEGTLHTLPHNSSSTSPAATTALHHSTGAQREQQLTQVFYRPPLQLIQEAAPLSVAAFPAHGLSQQQLQLIANAGHLGFASGRNADGSAAVSRRISPILSVLEDASSATSTDSMTPAPWHLTDRQMLEDTPGWLNIDFASEVRLEKKLGEGGFGQVFRARWRDKVIAAKLVPFMSLVAQQHHSMPVSLVSAAAGTPDAAAAAAGQPSSSNVTGTDGSQLGNMRLGVQFSSGSLRAIKVEIRVLSQLSHPNIVAFKGACLAPPHICILEELAEGGSLYNRLYSRSSASKAQQQQRQRQQQQAALATAASSSSSPAPQLRPRKAGGGGGSKGMLPPPLSVFEVLRIAIDVSHAMVYLHALQPQVVHRDLKPQNVLLDLQGMAKVCDFGISKMKDASLAASSTRLQAGTPAYMAPEQFEGCSVTDKVDVFAFGVLLWECFEQQQPWKELSPMQIIYSVGLQKERLQRPARCPDQLWHLIEACWAQDPRDRPSFARTLQTLQHLQQELSQDQQEAVAESPTGSSGQQQQPSQQPLQQLQQQQHDVKQAAQPEVQQLQQAAQQQGPGITQPRDQLVRIKAHNLVQQLPPSDTIAVAGTNQSQGGHEDVDAHVAVVS